MDRFAKPAANSAKVCSVGAEALESDVLIRGGGCVGENVHYPYFASHSSTARVNQQ
jgi:hypothetical protein